MTFINFGDLVVDAESIDAIEPMKRSIAREFGSIAYLRNGHSFSSYDAIAKDLYRQVEILVQTKFIQVGFSYLRHDRIVSVAPEMRVLEHWNWSGIVVTMCGGSTFADSTIKTDDFLTSLGSPVKPLPPLPIG